MYSMPAEHVLNELSDLGFYTFDKSSDSYIISVEGKQIVDAENSVTEDLLFNRFIVTEDELVEFKSQLTKAVQGDLIFSGVVNDTKTAVSKITNLSVVGVDNNSNIIIKAECDAATESEKNIEYISERFKKVEKYILLEKERAKFYRNNIEELLSPPILQVDSKTEISSAKDVTLCIEPTSIENPTVFDNQDNIITTSNYELGVTENKYDSFKSGTVYMDEKGTAVFIKTTEDLLISYVSILSDHVYEDGELVDIDIPAEPFDHGYFVLEKGEYKIWDTRN